MSPNARLCALVVLLAASACDRGEKPAPPPPAVTGPVVTAPTAPLAPAPSAAAEPSATAETRVELLESGASPRATLRYQLTAGAKSDAIVKVTTHSEIEAKGHPKREQPSVPTTLSMQFEVKEVLPTHARVSRSIQSLEFGDVPGLQPGARESMDAYAQGAAGIGVTYSFTPRGFTSQVEIDASSLQRPELQSVAGTLRDALGQVGAPLPEEPVGIGGRWRATGEVSVAGMTVLQEATYALVKLRGQEMDLLVELTQTGKPGALEMPGVPTGVVPEMVSMKATGSGTLHANLKSSIVTGDVQTTSDIVMRIRGPNSVQDLTTHNVVRMITEPGGLPPSKAGAPPKGP